MAQVVPNTIDLDKLHPDLLPAVEIINNADAEAISNLQRFRLEMKQPGYPLTKFIYGVRMIPGIAMQIIFASSLDGEPIIGLDMDVIDAIIMVLLHILLEDVENNLGLKVAQIRLLPKDSNPLEHPMIRADMATLQRCAMIVKDLLAQNPWDRMQGMTFRDMPNAYGINCFWECGS